LRSFALLRAAAVAFSSTNELPLMKDPRFAKFVLLVNGAVPLALLFWDWSHDGLGADPVLYAIHTTGTLAVIFLTLTLSITPVRKISGWNWLSHFRRMLGLYAFFYVCAHLLIYFVKDRAMSVSSTFDEAVKRPFIFLGMLALVFMIPLAVTSTNGMIRRLGAARWKRLHQLTYAVAILAIVHFWMAQKLKVAASLPMLFTCVLALLFGYRVVTWIGTQGKKASRAPLVPSPSGRRLG
jgi:DMSO/TMAO reductase YedYZ heme-binding membrane subunit